MLANELGRRGVDAVLIDEKPSTAFNPQANATQARTMEHYRRLGFADDIRALGLPADFPTDIAYFTRYARYELARFELPSARRAKESVASASNASKAWSAAEAPHRVSQKYVERVMRAHAERLSGISIRYGVRLLSFADQGEAVEALIEPVDRGAPTRLRADYLVGADGPRSRVRQALGISYAGEAGASRDFFGGLMYAIYLRAPRFYDLCPHAPAWMNVSFNPQRRAFMAAVDGRGEFAFHTQLRAHEIDAVRTDRDALALFQAAFGAPIEADILSRGTWTAGYALVAESFRRGRVFIGGDAAHLFTPAGGLGYNTAVEDAVNLGWKLAAALRCGAGPRLLDSYEAERRPLAARNTAFARAFADSLGLYTPDPEIEQDTPAGTVARAAAGAYLAAHGRAEFDIPGVTFGGRYDASPVIFRDGAQLPPDRANDYWPSASPGGRAPHLWLAPGLSLYDLFGFEWTLLCLGDRDRSGRAELARAARQAGLDIKILVLDNQELRDLYEADHALIRPDQIVAWRGDRINDPQAIVARVSGSEERDKT